MFNLPPLRIDRLSFWLGFLTASLLWWLLSRIRPLLPIWRDQFKQYLNTARQKNLTGVELFLRSETVRRAQRQHLAASLWSLDEILVQPWLLAPPSGQTPGEKINSQSIAIQVIPYMPDAPEIVAPFGVSRLSLAQAAQNGRDIAIIGQAGCGKTVALCHLACQIARQEETAGKLANAVPILLHILDLDISLKEGDSPLDKIILSAASQANIITQRQFPRFLKAVLNDKQRRVVLLLDGLDEITPEKLAETRKFLSALHRKHPRLQIIITASSDYVDGLTQSGFYPLGISAWGQVERDTLCQKWGDLWFTHISPENNNNDRLNTVDPLLLQHWLSAEKAYTTPLEWTLRLWGAYAGDVSGNRPASILETYLTRYLLKPDYILALEDLAYKMVMQSTAWLDYAEMETLLTKADLQPAAVPATGSSDSQALDKDDTLVSGEGKKPRQKGRRDLGAGMGEQLINRLISGGILVEHVNGMVRFSNPVLLGFLASFKISSDEAGRLVKQLNWSVANQTLQYASSRNEDGFWILPLIEKPIPPIYQNLLIAARWLRDAPPHAAWRSSLMRTLVGLLQTESLPLSVRARLINAFYLTRDPSTIKLLKQLLVSQSSIVRRAALLGCGALGHPQLINDVLELLADFDPQVRYTACLTLAAIPGEASLNAIVQILLTSDEELRQASAEALALNRAEGHQALQEAATVDDLLVRRAAVFGLLQIGEPWARDLIEKIAVEDGQWVVRNAAAQALEALQQANPAIPRPLPPPSESPWLITFASKLGKVLPPGLPATDVLLEVLRSGSVEEQIAALHYLRNQPEEGVINAIYNLVYGMEEEIHEPAIQALWWMAISGAELPDPNQYGLG